MNALGTPGTSKRRFFYGPGQDDYDMALAKNLPFREAKSLLLRVETFNIFNRAQFSVRRPSMATSAARRLAV